MRPRIPPPGSPGKGLGTVPGLPLFLSLLSLAITTSAVVGAAAAAAADVAAAATQLRSASLPQLRPQPQTDQQDLHQEDLHQQDLDQQKVPEPGQGLTPLARARSMVEDHRRHALAQSSPRLEQQQSAAEQGPLRRGLSLDPLGVEPVPRALGQDPLDVGPLHRRGLGQNSPCPAAGPGAAIFGSSVGASSASSPPLCLFCLIPPPPRCLAADNATECAALANASACADGTLYASIFSLDPLSTSSGPPCNCVYGYCANLGGPTDRAVIGTAGQSCPPRSPPPPRPPNAKRKKIWRKKKPKVPKPRPPPPVL